MVRKISSDHYFYASNGSVLTSKEDLLEFLRTCDDATFNNHVNEEHNDFANWTHDVLRIKKIAKKFAKNPSKDAMIAAIEETMKNKKSAPKGKNEIITQLVNAIGK